MTSPDQQLISDILTRLEVAAFGFTPLSPAISLSFYEDWLNSGYHGQMDYLRRHLETKKNPELLLPKARSAVVVAFPYRPHPRSLPLLKGLRIADYARGEDYHDWIKEKLLAIAGELKEVFPAEKFLCATDSSPILERDLAYRAGLGWVGKNTCLIEQKTGSFFLLGEILTTLNLSARQDIHADRCGTCNRCIEACPTQAILAPKKLDARKCISYLTIELKGVPEADLRAKIGDNFFGCDICQTVCPWNEKAFGPLLKEFQAPKLQVTDELVEDLRWLLSTGEKEIEKTLKGSPLLRAKGFGLKRNALIVVANQKLSSLTPLVKAHLTDPRLGELAQWTLQQL